MADIDPITREALKRASQLKSPRRQPRPQSSEPAEPPKPDIKPAPAPPPETQVPENTGLLGSLFRDKEQTIIMALILILLEEKADPALLLALIYLIT